MKKKLGKKTSHTWTRASGTIVRCTYDETRLYYPLNRRYVAMYLYGRKVAAALPYGGNSFGGRRYFYGDNAIRRYRFGGWRYVRFSAVSTVAVAVKPKNGCETAVYPYHPSRRYYDGGIVTE